MPTYSYSGDPSTSVVDEIRFIVGDVDDAQWLLSNEEITYVYTQSSNVSIASSGVVSAILAKVARYCEETVGDVVVKWQQMYANYSKLKKELDSFRSLESAGIYSGGISLEDKLSVQANRDEISPTFTKTFGTTYEADAGYLFNRTY